MDQYWIYVIIAIVYAIIKAVKKKEEGKPNEIPDRRQERGAKYNTSPPVERPKQLTFEELLKEITESKKPQRPSYQPVQPKAEYVDYDEQIEEEDKDLEDVNYDYRKKDKLYDVYEEAKRQAFERPSLEETMKVTDTNVQFGKFKVFEQGKQRNLLEEYTKDFQDGEGLKKAMVLTEILNRKF
jgi:hypothetical protein